MNDISIVKDIIVPVGILILSVGLSISFTLWREHTKVRSEKKERYFGEVEEWANSVIDLCYSMTKFPEGDHRENVLKEIGELYIAGIRFTTTSIKDLKKIREDIDQALKDYKITEKYPKFPFWRQASPELEILRIGCENIKLHISEIRYK